MAVARPHGGHYRRMIAVSTLKRESSGRITCFGTYPTAASTSHIRNHRRSGLLCILKNQTTRGSQFRVSLSLCATTIS